MTLLDKIKELNIPVVGSVGTFRSSEEILAHTKPLLKAEGFVVAFADGHRVKVKADQYVRIHKTKDQIATERNILALILNSELDDLLPILDEEDRKVVRQYEQKFWDDVSKCESRLVYLWNVAKDDFNGDKKRIALEMKPLLKNVEDAAFIFRLIDGADTAMELIVDKMLKSVGNGPRYDAAMAWLKTPAYTVKV